jgi:hypothetical protein
MTKGTNIVDVSMSLQAWSKFATFMWSDSRAAGLNANHLLNDQISIGQGFETINEKTFDPVNITQESFNDGVFGGFFNTSNTSYGGRMKVSLSVGIDNQINYSLQGNPNYTVENFVSSLVHEHSHGLRAVKGTILRLKSDRELDAIRHQMAHPTWEKTTDFYKESIMRYRNSFLRK